MAIFVRKRFPPQPRHLATEPVSDRFAGDHGTIVFDFPRLISQDHAILPNRMSHLHLALPDGTQEIHDEEELRGRWLAASLPEASLVWKEGLPGWVTAASYFGPIPSAPPRMPPPVPSHLPMPSAALSPYSAPEASSLQAPPRNGHGYRYTKPPGSLTKVVVILLGLSLLMELASSASSLGQFMLLGRDYTEAEANANDAREQIVGLFYVIIFIITAIAFLMWVHRASVNVHGFGAANLRFTPGWAVGWYFVPIMWLFRPFQAMKEIWQASRNPSAWHLEPGSALLRLWWTLWLCSNITGYISFGLSLQADTIDELRAGTLFDMVSCLIGVPLAVLAILVVKNIAASQEALVQGTPGASSTGHGRAG